MKKKLMKSLSSLALAAIIGASAFGALAHAEECSMLSLNAVACWSCGSMDLTEEYREEPDYSYMNSSEHLVTVTIHYECNVCSGGSAEETVTYTEGHDYELVEGTGKMICTGCYDSYDWSRVAFGESEE